MPTMRQCGFPLFLTHYLVHMSIDIQDDFFPLRSHFLEQCTLLFVKYATLLKVDLPVFVIGQDDVIAASLGCLGFICFIVQGHAEL